MFDIFCRYIWYAAKANAAIAMTMVARLHWFDLSFVPQMPRTRNMNQSFHNTEGSTSVLWDDDCSHSSTRVSADIGNSQIPLLDSDTEGEGDDFI